MDILSCSYRSAANFGPASVTAARAPDERSFRIWYLASRYMDKRAVAAVAVAAVVTVVKVRDLVTQIECLW